MNGRRSEATVGKRPKAGGDASGSPPVLLAVTAASGAASTATRDPYPSSASSSITVVFWLV